MKIECWAIGKPHETHVAQGVNDFTQRIGNYFPFEWRIFNLKKNAASLSEHKLKQDESAMILSALKPEDWLVSLDERAKA